MKITKTSTDQSYMASVKEMANRGCDRCPCCGESKTSGYYMAQEGYLSRKGIHPAGIKIRSKGGLFTKVRVMQVDCYRCGTCGAEWESDPYERII